jgi:MFS family permease
MNLSKNAKAEWRRFWFLPLTAALGAATSALCIYSLGPFMEPLSREFGWSRAQISVGISVATFSSGIFCVPIGILVDRVGPRCVGLIGVPAMSGVFALLSTTTGTTANWIGLWIGIAIGTMFVQPTVWTSAVASRFEASRGLAFAITLSGSSVAAIVNPVLATWLIGNYGWRTAFAAMGGGWALLVFPILVMFFRGAQDTGPKERVAASSAVLTGITVSEGLRSPALYKLLLAIALFTFTASGALVHFVPILTDRGATPLAAAGIASLIGIFSIVGRLGTGALLDRFPAHLIGATAFMLPILAAALLLWDGANPVSQSIAAATLGLTVGSEVDVIAYLAARHFGLKNFGALYGALLMALSLGAACGPLAAGAVFDRYGSYAPFLMLTMLTMPASAAALGSLGRPATATATATS